MPGVQNGSLLFWDSRPNVPTTARSEHREDHPPYQGPGPPRGLVVALEKINGHDDCENDKDHTNASILMDALFESSPNFALA
jgi:hypothetical protein